MLKKTAFILIVIILVTQVIISWRGQNNRPNQPLDRLGSNSSTTLVTLSNQVVPSEIKIHQAPLVVDLLASSYQFTPSLIKGRVGVPLKVRVLSKGDHNFTISEFGVKTLTPDNKNTDILFIPTQAGTYRFYSSLPADLAHRMTGRLIVK